VCHFCKRELVAYENGLANGPLFYVTQRRGFRREVWDMTETQLYGFLGARLEGDLAGAEAALQELNEKGIATVRYDAPLYGPTALEIRRA